MKNTTTVFNYVLFTFFITLSYQSAADTVSILEGFDIGNKCKRTLLTQMMTTLNTAKKVNQTADRAKFWDAWVPMDTTECSLLKNNGLVQVSILTRSPEELPASLQVKEKTYEPMACLKGGNLDVPDLAKYLGNYLQVCFYAVPIKDLKSSEVLSLKYHNGGDGSLTQLPIKVSFDKPFLKNPKEAEKISLGVILPFLLREFCLVAPKTLK